MSLRAGVRLGSYDIVGPLGAGVIGEAYRARDTRLRREAAIEMLPASFASDGQRPARFEREAQLLASLNHPDISIVHGLEEWDGRRALVLELVEGRTLAESIAERPIPMDDAIAVARQIAIALEAAHERGIIHRDLKPANIKWAPDGTVKVLDFGLAKALDPAIATAGPNVSSSPTFTARASEIGMILGTAAYMAPEQARGKLVDRRADIWAFGAVLYEMLTGRRAFGGDDATDVIASVLIREPDWTALPDSTPPPLRRLLRRCLQKEPGRRLHHIADARLDLDEAVEARDAPPIPISTGRLTRTSAIAMGVGCLLLAITAFLAGVSRQSRGTKVET